MSKYVIDAGHHVLVVFDAPAPAPRRPQKVFAVASGAARIRVQHGIAIGGEELQLEIEVVAVGAVRSAVDGKNERQSFTGGVCRDQDPTFDLRAVLAIEGDSRRRVEVDIAEKGRVHVR